MHFNQHWGGTQCFMLSVIIVFQRISGIFHSLCVVVNECCDEFPKLSLADGWLPILPIKIHWPGISEAYCVDWEKENGLCGKVDFSIINFLLSHSLCVISISSITEY